MSKSLFRLAGSLVLAAMALCATGSGANAFDGGTPYTISGTPVSAPSLAENWPPLSSLLQCSAAEPAATGCLLSTPIHLGVSIEKY